MAYTYFAVGYGGCCVYLRYDPFTAAPDVRLSQDFTRPLTKKFKQTLVARFKRSAANDYDGYLYLASSRALRLSEPLSKSRVNLQYDLSDTSTIEELEVLFNDDPLPAFIPAGATNPELTHKGTNTMSTTEMITIMQLETGASIVKVAYAKRDASNMLPAKYSFKDVIGLNLAVGDVVAVEGLSSDFVLATVTDIDVLPTDISCELSDLKHVVCKMDNEAYKQAKDREATAKHQLALSEVTSRLSVYREQVGNSTFDAVSNLLTNTTPVLEVATAAMATPAHPVEPPTFLDGSKAAD